MSALPLPNTAPRSKPARKKISIHEADPSPLRSEPPDRKSVYAEFKGSGTAWAPINVVFDAERARLASTKTFWGLTTYITQRCARGREKDKPLTYESEVNLVEAGLFCGVTEKQIRRELTYMQERDMAVVAMFPGGRAVVRLIVLPEIMGEHIFPGWANIELDYDSWRASRAESLEEQAAEEAQADDVALDKENTYVKVKPQSIKRGKGSKQKIDGFVKSMRVQCAEDSPVDINVSGELVSGELVLLLCGSETQNPKSKNVAKPAESITSKKLSGHGCPTEQKLPPNEGSRKYPPTRVNPRAAELAGLFDPLCKLSNSKILSGDPLALEAACVAAGDIPRADLTAFVLHRAERSISGPKACIAITKEAVANWQAGGKGHVSADNTRGIGDERARQVIAGLKSLDEMRRRGRG